MCKVCGRSDCSCGDDCKCPKPSDCCDKGTKCGKLRVISTHTHTHTHTPPSLLVAFPVSTLHAGILYSFQMIVLAGQAASVHHRKVVVAVVKASASVETTVSVGTSASVLKTAVQRPHKH